MLFIGEDRSKFRQVFGIALLGSIGCPCTSNENKRFQLIFDCITEGRQVNLKVLVGLSNSGGSAEV